jgi:cell division protease FtsH
MLNEKREQLELIAQGLLEYETLDGKQIQDILEFGEMKNPPRPTTPPDLPQETPPASSVKRSEDDIENDDGPVAEPVGAPA